ncbi:MAG TPA: DUF1629 domain-containing protein [Vitreimonas sp.]|jgi:hypothetical protein|nr:DUF1629 domain-containing protein [Vitreimonas sp.]
MRNDYPSGVLSMNASIDQRPALLELAGEPIGPFSLRSRGEIPTGAEHKFLETLFNDNGESIATIVPPDLSVRIGLSDPGEVPDCFKASGRIIVSTAFKKVVEAFDISDTEFFPLKVVTTAPGADFESDWRVGATLENYWLMNCWNRLDATNYIDVENSDLKWQKSFVGHRPPWITGWERLVLKKQINADLWGLADNMPRRRFVSKRLKDAADAAGLRVGIFQKPLVRRASGG